MPWDKKTSYKALSLVVVLIAFSFIVSGFDITGAVVNGRGIQTCAPSSGSFLINEFENNVGFSTNSLSGSRAYLSTNSKTGSKSVLLNYTNTRYTWSNAEMNLNPRAYRYLEFWIKADPSNIPNNYPQLKMNGYGYFYERNNYAEASNKGEWKHVYVDFGSQKIIKYLNFYYYKPWFGNSSSAAFYIDDLRLTNTLSTCVSSNLSLTLSIPTQNQVLTLSSLNLQFLATNAPTGSKINLSLDRAWPVQLASSNRSYQLAGLSNGSHIVSLELVQSDGRSLSPRIFVERNFRVNLPSSNQTTPITYSPNITSAVRSGNRVALSWTFSKPGSNYFYIYRNTINSISSSPINPMAVFSRMYNDTNAPSTNRYYYWVKANGQSAEVSSSKCVSGTGFNQNC